MKDIYFIQLMVGTTSSSPNQKQKSVFYIEVLTVYEVSKLTVHIEKKMYKGICQSSSKGTQ